MTARKKFEIMEDISEAIYGMDMQLIRKEMKRRYNKAKFDRLNNEELEDCLAMILEMKSA